MQENQYDQLLKDVERIKKCSIITKQEINKSIDSVLELLTEAKNQINEPMEIEDHEVNKKKIKDSIHNLHEKLKVKLFLEAQQDLFMEKKPLKSVIDSHKKYFQYLSKYGKNIEKIFRSDINNVFKDTIVAFEKDKVNEAIAEHLLIEKKFDLYESFVKETGLSQKVDKEKLNSLKIIQKLLSSLLIQYKNKIQIFDEFKNQQLNEAINWAESKKTELEGIDSPLLFYLHRLQGNMDSIKYARKHFNQFFQGKKKFADQVTQVMFYLVYDERQIQHSQIKKCQNNILEKNMSQVNKNSTISKQKSYFQTIFARSRVNFFQERMSFSQHQSILDLTIKSALLQCLIAGTLALPKFLKYTQISSMDEELRDYHDKNEYPIEVEIGKDFKYHSIFVCPISRDVIEPDQNPVLLTCGHVISEASMKKITTNTNKDKFKCPTCPKEMTAKDTKKIYF